MTSKAIKSSKHLTSAHCILGTALVTEDSGFPTPEDQQDRKQPPLAPRLCLPQRYYSLNNRSPPSTNAPLYPGPSCEAQVLGNHRTLGRELTPVCQALAGVLGETAHFQVPFATVLQGR